MPAVALAVVAVAAEAVAPAAVVVAAAVADAPARHPAAGRQVMVRHGPQRRRAVGVVARPPPVRAPARRRAADRAADRVPVVAPGAATLRAGVAEAGFGRAAA
jgi:hypothetical protein